MKKTITILICCLALGVSATLQAAPKSKPGTSAGVFSEKFTKGEKNSDFRLQAETAQQTSDGGYISILNDYSYAGVIIIKTNGKGKKSWERVFGFKTDSNGQRLEVRYGDDIQQTSDGGYLATGRVNDFLWVLRLNSEGKTVWEKKFDGKGWRNRIAQNQDGSFLITAVYANTVGMGIEGNILLLKFAPDGAILLQRQFENVSRNGSVRLLPQDDGYLMAYDRTPPGAKHTGFRMMRLDAAGTPLWSKDVTDQMGIKTKPVIHALAATADGGYVVMGAVGKKRFVAKYDHDGKRQWDSVFPGIVFMVPRGIVETGNGGFAICGEFRVQSNWSAVMFAKMDSAGKFVSTRIFGVMEGGYLDCNSIANTRDGGFILAGKHEDKGSAAWLLKLDANGDNKAEPQLPIRKFFSVGVGNEYKLVSQVNRYDGDGKVPIP